MHIVQKCPSKKSLKWPVKYSLSWCTLYLPFVSLTYPIIHLWQEALSHELIKGVALHGRASGARPAAGLLPPGTFTNQTQAAFWEP